MNAFEETIEIIVSTLYAHGVDNPELARAIPADEH